MRFLLTCKILSCYDMTSSAFVRPLVPHYCLVTLIIFSQIILFSFISACRVKQWTANQNLNWQPIHYSKLFILVLFYACFEYRFVVFQLHRWKILTFLGLRIFRTFFKLMNPV